MESRVWRRAAVATVLLLLPWAAVAQPQPITVSASVESNDVAVGEPFLLSIVVDGAQNVPVPVVEVADFRADYLGPSTQVSLVNGRMSTRVTHRYRMIAHEPGQFTLGPFVVGHDDQRFETTPIAVRVRPAGTRAQAPAAPGGGQALRLVVQPTRDAVYVGERVDVVVTLYVGDVRLRDVQYPVIRADGVTVGKFGQADQGSEVIDGRRYSTVRLRTHLIPVRPGDIDLQTTMNATVVSGRRGFDSFFDQLLPGDARQVEVQAEPARIAVLPLPDAGRPPGFGGAVGSYEFALSAQPTTLDAGDPITVRMEIRGIGNLGTVEPPPLPVGADFRRYDPQPVKGEDGDERRVFEQVVIPNSPQVRELPAVSFSFFDPDARAYRTITRGPVPLEVRAAAPGRAAVVDAAPPLAPTPAAAAPLGRDIVYIKEAAGVLQPRGAPGIAPGWLLALLLGPPLSYGGVAAWARRRERLAADPRRARFRAAGAAAQRALAAARQGEGGIDATAAALTTYLAAKLDLPPGAVERERVVARLAAAGVAEPVRGDVARFFAVAEQARYGAGRDAAAAEVAALAERVVGALERERGLERLLGGLLLVVLAAAQLARAAAAAEPPLADYLRGNQAYAAGHYEQAVAAYEAVRAAGWESGAASFNLGNAYMKVGDIGRAIVNYERAARRLPRDPDVAANLAFARERAAIAAPAVPLWQRLLAPLASRATAAELTVAFAVFWLGGWALLAIRVLLGGRRAGLLRAAALAGGLAVLIGVSLAVRLLAVEAGQVAVVIATGQTPVRFEPSPQGTEHFVVTPGDGLAIEDERDGWRLVSRADGRRGWLPAAAVEPL